MSILFNSAQFLATLEFKPKGVYDTFKKDHMNTVTQMEAFAKEKENEVFEFALLVLKPHQNTIKLIKQEYQSGTQETLIKKRKKDYEVAQALFSTPTRPIMVEEEDRDQLVEALQAEIRLLKHDNEVLRHENDALKKKYDRAASHVSALLTRLHTMENEFYTAE